MKSQAVTVQEYLTAQSGEQRKTLEAVRNVIRKNLDERCEEGMLYGMISYFVPHRVYPAGYHCNPKQPLPFASLAAQKNYFALYLMSLYLDPVELARFCEQWKKTGKKLDMGKSCIRFKDLDGIALDVVAEHLRRVPADAYIAQYEAAIGRGERKSDASRQSNPRRLAASAKAGAKRESPPRATRAAKSAKSAQKAGVAAKAKSTKAPRGQAVKAKGVKAKRIKPS